MEVVAEGVADGGYVVHEKVVVLEGPEQREIGSDAHTQRQLAQGLAPCGTDDEATGIVDQSAEHQQEDEKRLPSHIKDVAGNQKNRPASLQPKAEERRGGVGKETCLLKGLKQ